MPQDTPYKCELYSIDGNQRMLTGTDAGYDIISRSSGVKQFRQYDDLADTFYDLTANQSDTLFADTFAKLTRAALEKTNAIGTQLDNIQIDTSFGGDRVSQQFEQVSKLIKLRDSLETERAVFVVERGGFDTHNTWNLDPMLGDINAGLASFRQEMRAQGVWDDVTFVTVSDFARTLTSNGQGSDHAWGGNHFIAGGSIDGGKFFGSYPDSLDATGDLNIGRGRLVPTQPWEYMWSGIVEWFGVQPSQMAEVLPHLENFGADQRTDAQGTQTLYGAGGGSTEFVQWGTPPNLAPTTVIEVEVGDSVAFNWIGYHDLHLMADHASYTSCDFTGSTELASDSIGGSHTYTATTPGTFYFACAVSSHCGDGMKIAVVVKQTVNVAWTFSGSGPGSDLGTQFITLGDTVNFAWAAGPNHDLVMLAGDSCDFTGSTELAPESTTGSYDFTPTAAGTYYFGCSVGAHCASGGMRITVTVTA